MSFITYEELLDTVCKFNAWKLLLQFRNLWIPDYHNGRLIVTAPQQKHIFVEFDDK
jgi:hypothetical protein